jgi:hypothetical protein
LGIFVRHWVVLVGLPLLAANVRVIDFDALPVGAAPPGWTVAATHPGPGARWEVRKDQTAPTQPYVLAQVSHESPGNRYPLAILDAITFRDGEVSVRIKPMSGPGGQTGGLVWRYRDPLNYYVVRANATEKTVAVFRVQNGQISAILKPARYEVAANAWSILKITTRGPKFQVYMDHRRVLEGQDAAFPGPGKVGLCTVDESEVYFDDFRVNQR